MGSTTSDEGWDWTFSARADEQFASLDPEIQDRIVSKLDEVVGSEFRDPEDFLDPLRNSPFQKLRIGDYRLGCRVDRSEQILRVGSVRKREGAYEGDDD